MPGPIFQKFTPQNRGEIGFFLLLVLGGALCKHGYTQDGFPKGDLLYTNTFATVEEISDWTLEGPGTLDFQEDWMHMQSPGEVGHHVFWCPQDFPSSFVAQWEMQNIETDAGLCIVFFCCNRGKWGRHF